jgi:hypothetical protein
MLAQQPNNLLEIDELIDNFLQEHQAGISTIHRTYYHTDNQLSLHAFIAELMDELRTGCVTFFNKGLPQEEINSYLFYIVNAFAKKISIPLKAKTRTEYLCPGCLFLGNEALVTYVNTVFKCDNCAEELKTATDPKKVLFYRTFFRHNKQGYRCCDCERFIPHPLDESPIISCPYFDCCFVGPWHELRRMHHPSTESNPEKLILDTTQEGGQTLHDTLADNKIDAHSQLEMEEELKRKVKLLQGVIDTQYHNVPYSSAEFTIKHKMFCYQAFDNLLKKHPLEMVEYLLNSSRSGGFQHKVFQEYIRLLEESLPLMFKKNKKLYKISSLLDENLSLFDGISSFNAIVTDKGTIKNGTTEFYIGGRKAQVTRPYYIGKLLNILDKKNKEPLLDRVLEYSFSVIKTRDIVPGTWVTVTHLRVPPHYQMGGMVYVNRIRKKIVDRARLLEGVIKNNE